jgi:hypothetical protein
MMLIEEGKLKLDEPIDLLAPELADHRVLKRIDGPLDDTVPAKRAITLEDVMTFRLGWGVLFADTYPIARATADLPGFGMPNNVSAVDEDLKLRASHCAPSYITRVSLASKKLIVGGEGTNAGITSRDPGRSATIALSF